MFSLNYKRRRKLTVVVVALSGCNSSRFLDLTYSTLLSSNTALIYLEKQAGRSNGVFSTPNTINCRTGSTFMFEMCYTADCGFVGQRAWRGRNR